VSRPTLVRFRAGTRSVDLELDDEGRGELPQPWTVSAFSLQILQSETAFSVQGQQFVPLTAGISDIRLDGRSLKPHPAHLRAFPCGSGPDLVIGGRVVQTTFRASTLALIRGRSVPLEACGGDEIPLGITATDVLAKPTPLFRVDTLSLTRVSAQPSAATPLDVQRDSGGTPESVDLPRRTGPSVLVLPQNFNDGWVALSGKQELEPQRADGWKQGWIVPGGDATTVTFDYRPEHTFRIALGAGAVGLLICLGAALLRPRRSARERSPRPALAAGGPGLLDVAVVLAAGGLLVGWYGLAAVAAALVAGVAVRRFEGWGALAGAAMLLAGAGLSWDRITQATWANEWRQSWSLVAAACLVAALATTLSRPELRMPRMPRRRRGRAVTEGAGSSPPRSRTRRALRPGRRR
jgi:arabinofuranan 3-O-arabinosyltransferase